MHTFSPLRTVKLHLTSEQPSMDNVRSHQKKKKKKKPHVQEQRRIPSKTVGGVKLHLGSNILPTRDIQRAQINLVCTRTQKPHRD